MTLRLKQRKDGFAVSTNLRQSLVSQPVETVEKRVLATAMEA